MFTQHTRSHATDKARDGKQIRHPLVSGENDLRWKLTSEEKLKSATVTGRGDQGLKQSTRTKVTIDNFWK